jgi:glycerophosphoryl diester phosphodiesterase
LVFKVVAHRGVTARAPGNTMAAFRAALELGADAVELDVRLSRDGVPMVHHNWYLDENATPPGADLCPDGLATPR